MCLVVRLCPELRAPRTRSSKNASKNLSVASVARVRTCCVESFEHNRCGLVPTPAHGSWCAYKEEVGGSRPSAPTRLCRSDGVLASRYLSPVKCHPRILRRECGVHRRFRAARSSGWCLVLREGVCVVPSSSLFARWSCGHGFVQLHAARRRSRNSRYAEPAQEAGSPQIPL